MEDPEITATENSEIHCRRDYASLIVIVTGHINTDKSEGYENQNPSDLSFVQILLIF